MLNEIKELTTLLAECRQKLKEFKVQIQHLENQDSQTLQSKKQELKSLQDELTKCQQERDSIQTKLDKKVEELKSSQLSNDEKAQQITDLLTTHQKELDLINQELTQAWMSYTQQQTKLIHYLTQPCAGCQCKSKSVKDLAKMKNWLMGVVSILLILLLLSLLPKRKSKLKKLK